MNNAILLCGGCGRRMAPISDCNKSLLKIRGEINLKRIVRILYKRGIREIILATNPLSFLPIFNLVTDIREEFPGVHFILIESKGYYRGCNNIVTLKSAKDYIDNTYILETDQYYLGENLDFIESTPQEHSYFFTQSRGEEDWGVITDNDSNIVEIIHHNKNYEHYCLAGISYFTGDASKYLRDVALDTEETEIYWEESIKDYSGIKEKRVTDSYAIEFDNISDLINKSLMSPQEIADLIDDNHEAERLGSMTNTTYKVSISGETYALRIPGCGTDKFIDHHRERYIESFVPSTLRPTSTYFSDDNVKLTEYLEGYSVLNDLSKFEYVAKSLFTLHNLPKLPPEYNIDLQKEIKDYEDIYFMKLSPYEGYKENKSIVLKYLEDWFSSHPYEVCHRDLVPLNIMLNEENDVKLIDWEYSGMLSSYWDLASLCCEYSDEYSTDLDTVIIEICKTYPAPINLRHFYCWIAIVDFIWSVWSLAKCALGDDVAEYGIRRYNRSSSLINKYMRGVEL